MKKILILILCELFLGSIVLAENKVIIDGVSKDGVSIVITTISSPAPAPAPIPVPAPTPAPPPSPAPISPLGSKTNPIPMNKLRGGRGLVYLASTATGSPNLASTPLAGGQKVYFMVDTAVTGQTISYFKYTVQGFNNPNLVYSKVVQDKQGNDLTSETTMSNNTGDTTDTIYNNQSYPFSNTRFLYAIENKAGAYSADVWVQFLP